PCLLTLLSHHPPTTQIYTLSLHDALPILVSVRVNGVDTPWCYRDVVDVVEAAGDRIDTVYLPKVEPGADVQFLDRLLAQIELARSEEHTSELQSLRHLVCRLLLEKKK